jgi:hypothetical protein
VVEGEQHDRSAHLGADPAPLVALPDPGAGADLPADGEVARAEPLGADDTAVEPHQEVHRPALRDNAARSDQKCWRMPRPR